MPIRLCLLLPPPKRSRNHALNLLWGWCCSQHPAISTAIVRSRRLPALLIPCSRSPSPLWYGVGVSPASAPNCLRFLIRRQPKNSITYSQALFARPEAARVQESPDLLHRRLGRGADRTRPLVLRVAELPVHE